MPLMLLSPTLQKYANIGYRTDAAWCSVLRNLNIARWGLGHGGRPLQCAPAPASGVLKVICPSVTLTLIHLGTGGQCNPWHGQPSCQYWCFCDCAVSSYAVSRRPCSDSRHVTAPYKLALYYYYYYYGQTRAKQTTWRYNLDLWPLRSPRTPVLRVIV